MLEEEHRGVESAEGGVACRVHNPTAHNSRQRGCPGAACRREGWCDADLVTVPNTTDFNRSYQSSLIQ